MKEKLPADEQIISALFANKTIKATAAELNVSERTLYSRMNDSDFKELYQAAKADLLRNAVLNINGKLHAAIEAVTEIMMDKENNPAIRLQAAQTLLNNAGKLSDRLQSDECRLEQEILQNQWTKK